MRHGRILTAAFAALVLALQAPAGAGAVEDYGKRGRLSSSGSVEFWVQPRDGSIPTVDPILAFGGASDEDGIVIAVRWGDAPGVFFESRRYDVWGQGFLFEDRPQDGGWVHVVLTYEPNRAFVNGKEVLEFKTKEGTKPDRGTASLAGKGMVEGRQPAGRKGRDWEARNTIIGGVETYGKALIPAEVAGLYASRMGTGLAISSFSQDAAWVASFSGKLVAGNALAVQLQGTPGATGTFDVVHYPGFDRTIKLDWRGWGVYLEEKKFFDAGEVNLRDVEGYEVYVSQEPFDVATLGVVSEDPAAPPGLQPVETLEVEEQTYTLEWLEMDKPYYVAVMAKMRDGSRQAVLKPAAGQALVESAPGVYGGTWTVGFADRYARAAVLGRLSSGTQSASLLDPNSFAVDPALTIAVETEPKVLKADEKSTAKVTVTVTDANGNPVADHEVKFLLATTSQYTGVVGGGAFEDQVGGSVKERARGKTDLFGRLTATYVAGFAAKTAVIVARDMSSNDTGAGFVKSYIQATAQLELEPVQSAAAEEGYEIAVTSSDEWLTADGKSQARITARVTRAGQPVEGHAVKFTVSSGTGSVRTVKDTTGKDGEARAVYTAGKKIGVVVVTATDTTVDISGSVSIELRSDAPAKIAVKLDPEKLPADGRSRAELTVLVTDINDNPNDNVEVEYAISQGGGDLREEATVTDRRGETTNTYTAGRTPGLVTIDLTVRSPEPTEEEIGKARDLAVAVTDYKFF